MPMHTVTPPRPRPPVGLLAAAVLLALAGAACAAAGASPAPTEPAPSPAPTTIATAEDAAAAAKAANPLLGPIEERDPELIGQAMHWTAEETGDGWQVTFEVGWGDCPAGCINRHAWQYGVTRDGAVTLDEERGDPIPPEILAGLGGGPPPGTTGVHGTVTAGPVCPVAQNPPDPNCDPRPVAGAVLVIRGPDGTEAGRVQTDDAGRFELALEPGDYVLEPQDVEGLLGTAPPMPFTVEQGASTALEVPYDTGIR